VTSARTARAIGRDPSFHPVTWTLDRKFLNEIWRETLDVFGNKLWHESMYGLFPDEWQEELGQRSGRDVVDVLYDGLDKPSSYLALDRFCGSLRRALEPYGITLRFPPGITPTDAPAGGADDEDEDEFGDFDFDELDDFDEEP
jgi:hypothetical protein